ncbi:MAG: hypothetical protein ACR2M0_03495 [Chloroflexia bacterium]
MHGNLTATTNPYTALAPGPPSPAEWDPHHADNLQHTDSGPVVGDLDPALIREWGPLLKPTGIGLLVALHSLEEAVPGHPRYGWAHCTQTALSAYLGTSQDTIARYTNLLQLCGLLIVEEVETPRGRQKLYRVARGLLLPSLGLIEYLIFDADNWTRKHTAWLAASVAPLGPATELTRLTALMARAYRVQTDPRGIASLLDGARLTHPDTYLRRREPSATQPALTLPEAPALTDSAPCVQPPAPTLTNSASSGQPSTPPSNPAAQSGQPTILPADPYASSAQPHDPTSDQSALSGLADSTQSAPNPPTPHSALRTPHSAQSGLAGSYNVTVDRSYVKETDANDNGTPPNASAPDGQAPVDAESLARWGAAALSDIENLEWHRRCLSQYGTDSYCWAVEATQKAQARGTVSKPGAYFTSLLRKRGLSLASPAPKPPAPAPQSTSPPLGIVTADPSPPPASPSSPTGMSEADCAHLWQTALIHLRVGLPIEDYTRILRYAVLLELDTVSGWALFGLPTDFMRDQVAGRLAGPISIAFGQVCGTTLHIAAAVHSGQGRLAASGPTLAALLAARAEPPLDPDSTPTVPACPAAPAASGNPP